MTNPRTIDRLDVAHKTNPVGDNETIENAKSNMAALPRGVAPARSGRSQTDAVPAAPDKDNPARMDQKRNSGRDTVHVQSPDKIAQ